MPNSSLNIDLVWLEHGQGLSVPGLQTAGAAGVDLQAAIGAADPLVLPPGQRAMVPCGFAMALPSGFEAQIRPRSGLAAKYGITLLNAPGTIDADYRGEIKAILINFGDTDFVVQRGDRIAQMVIAPVTAPAFTLKDSLDVTDRGANGFGSTGHKIS